MAEQIDWNALAGELSAIRSHMICHEEPRLYGAAFDAEALRRLFGYRPANDAGPDGRDRALPYESIRRGTGLITLAEANHERDGHTFWDRRGRERAEEQVRELRAEVARVYREARADVAAAIRSRCNERIVPSRYRREGVLLAADWIAPPRREQARTDAAVSQSEQHLSS